MNAVVCIASFVWGVALGFYVAVFIVCPTALPDFFKITLGDLIRSGATLFVGFYIARVVNFKINRNIKNLEVNRDFIDTIVSSLDSFYEKSTEHLLLPQRSSYDSLIINSKDLSNYITLFGERVKTYHLTSEDFDKIKELFFNVKSASTGASLAPLNIDDEDLKLRRNESAAAYQQMKMLLMRAKLNLF